MANLERNDVQEAIEIAWHSIHSNGADGATVQQGRKKEGKKHRLEVDGNAQNNDVSAAIDGFRH